MPSQSDVNCGSPSMAEPCGDASWPRKARRRNAAIGVPYRQRKLPWHATWSNVNPITTPATPAAEAVRGSSEFSVQLALGRSPSVQ